MNILGISAYYHDSAACLIKDGEIIAAAQEERFTRIKHDARFPSNAINYCLKEAQINSEQINNVIFYEKPFMKFERLLETYLAFAPKGFSSFAKAMPVWVKDKLFQKSVINKNLNMERMVARDEDDYVDKVVNLSNNHDDYIKLRKSIFLDALKSPLFNVQNYSKSFFEALERIVN